MRQQEKEQPFTDPQEGPGRFPVSSDPEPLSDLDRIQKSTYVEGRSPSGTWSLVSLLDTAPGPEPFESS